MKCLKQRLGLYITLSVICPTTIFGQEFAHRSEISAGAGYGNFFDDEGSLGTGPTYRVGTGWRPSGRLQIKAELLGIHHTRHDNFQVGGDSLFVFGNAVYYFSRSRVQPYLFGGLGAHKADFAYSWPATSNGEYHMSKTGLAFDFGTGIKLFVSRHWSIDPEFRLAFSNSYYSLVNYLSASAAYHW